MIRRKDTVIFDRPPVIAAWAAAGGKKESEGPLAEGFDFLTQDAAFSGEACANWEQAESLLQQKAAEACLRKAGIGPKAVDLGEHTIPVRIHNKRELLIISLKQREDAYGNSR